MPGNLQYFFANSGSTTKTKSEKANVAESFSHWVRIPRGSTDIHFEIPYYEVDKADKASVEASESEASTVRDILWPATIPIQLRNLLDSTALSEGESSPPYSYKVWDADKNKLACLFFCRSHSASIQVFHTNGHLLTGTPLANWDTCIGVEDFDECNGYVGGLFSPDATPTGELIWQKCGIWAEWFSAVTALEGAASSDSILGASSFLPSTGTLVSPEDITTKLQNHYPTIFPSSFEFDDSLVNGTQAELLKTDDSTMHTLSVEGETIQWTGCIGGATGLGAVDHRAQQLGSYNLTVIGSNGVITHTSSPYEILDIAEAQADLIIGFLSSDGVAGWGRWIEPDEEEEEEVPYLPELPVPLVPEFENRQVYRDFQNLAPIYRGDDMVIHKPYAGAVGFRDGRYIVASRDRGKLAMLSPDDQVICTADPLARRLNADKTICYGIALHVNEKTLYMLVGEEGSSELYVTRIEIESVPLSTMDRDMKIYSNIPKPNAESIMGSVL